MNKTVGFVSTYEELTKNNYIFNFPDGGIGDNLYLPFVELKSAWEKIGINACTPDTTKLENIDSFIFMDMPDEENKYFMFAKDNNVPMYLLIEELILHRTENMNLSRHAHFRKIFTYQDDMIDNKKYFKLNYSHRIPDRIPRDITQKRKLCTVIAGKKTLNHPLELYSKRVEAIRWFEEHHPEEFDLYGINWNKPRKFQGGFSKILNRSTLIRKLCTKKFPSWRGTIKNKRDVLKKYKFSICYENCKNVKGYITEKIFDCFFAGCIPVYWGADNITDHTPKECFIDKRDFSTYECLYEYMVNMTAEQYSDYLTAIESFLRSQKPHPFTIDYFIETLTKEIASDSL